MVHFGEVFTIPMPCKGCSLSAKRYVVVPLKSLFWPLFLLPGLARSRDLGVMEWSGRQRNGVVATLNIMTSREG